MENYVELRNRQQKEFNEFPCFFAYNEEQFKEGMKKLGIRSTKALYRGVAGMFYKKEDSNKLKSMLKRHAMELKKAFEDDEFLYKAFRDKMANHEFCITYDPEPTLDALGLERDEVERSQRMVRIWKKAEKDYLDSVIG